MLRNVEYNGCYRGIVQRNIQGTTESKTLEHCGLEDPPSVDETAQNLRLRFLRCIGKGKRQLVF